MQRPSRRRDSEYLCMQGFVLRLDSGSRDSQWLSFISITEMMAVEESFKGVFCRSGQTAASL